MPIYDINIFIPDFTRIRIEHIKFVGYVVNISDDILALYLNNYSSITEADKPHSVCCNKWPCISDRNILYGCMTEKNCLEIEEVSKNEKQRSNYVKLETENRCIELVKLKIDGKVLDIKLNIRNIAIIFYNQDSIDISECVFNTPIIRQPETEEYGFMLNQFDVLKSIIDYKSHSCGQRKTSNETFSMNNLSRFSFFLMLFNTVRPFLNYSNLFVQICQFLKIIHWIVKSLRGEKKMAVKTGNLISALIIDICGGAIILFWINQWSSSPMNELFDLIELIVEYFKTLLKWLMGSPAGLKLNHAFNSMLGKFFLYHIDLWWMFLVISKNVLEIALQIFQFLGMLGITFQAAILADLLSLVSFHIYCIYTYAARLYNIQVSGLISLWRLFLGRKHNPLRGGVDSCQYNHHQLFIGTLAFTILLFLLPTTALYYVVFTIFRIMLILTSGLLIRIQYFIQSFPLYLFALWAVNSPRIAGDIKISIIESDSQSKSMCLLLELKMASFFQIIETFEPTPIIKPEAIKWKEIFSNLWRGNLLYPV